MLILTRKSGQSFHVGDEVTITITEIVGDKVKIGIDAPQTMRVLRGELERTMESNRQAAGLTEESALRALAASLSARKPADQSQKP